MILEITKIQGGLSWDNKNLLFTNSCFESGYEIQGDDIALIELDDQVFVICCKDSTIDGQSFATISEEISYIFG